MELHVYDIFMVVVIVVATLYGAWKGMAWQLASLASIVASWFLAARFAGQLAPSLPGEAPFNKFLAMLVIYVGSSAVIWLAFNLLSHLIERVKLQEFDHQVGAAFGAAKGVVLGVAITFFAVALSDRAREVIMSTRSGYYAGQALRYVQPILPKEWNEVMKPHFERFAQAEAAAEGAQPWKAGSVWTPRPVEQATLPAASHTGVVPASHSYAVPATADARSEPYAGRTSPYPSAPR